MTRRTDTVNTYYEKPNHVNHADLKHNMLRM